MSHTLKSLKRIVSKEYLKSGITILIILFSTNLVFLNGMKYVIQYLVPALGGSLAITGATISITLLTIGIIPALLITLLDVDLKILGRFSILLIPVSLVLLYFVNGWLLVVPFALVAFGSPLITAVTEQAINDRIPTRERATILSIRGMVARLISGVVILIFGVALDYLNIDAAVAVLIGWGILSAIAYLAAEKQLGNNLYK